MKRNLNVLLACLATQFTLAEPSLAEKNATIKKEWESWNAPFRPFRLIGNIHYVGASGISSFLTCNRERMTLLVIGSGGREHALVWKLAQSSHVTH